MTDIQESHDLTPDPTFTARLKLPLFEDALDLTPAPNFMGALQSDNMTLWDGISELVDNSLDAGATEIDIKINQQRIEVRDNGRGCDSIKRILRLGEYGERIGSTVSGYFGQGAATAAMALGRIIEIETIADRIKRSVKLDWNKQRESGSWVGPAPKAEVTKEPSGTAIILSGLKKPTAPKSITAVKTHIQRIFTPGIKNGCNILINGELIAPLKFHPLHEAVEIEGEFEGRHYNLRFGTFKQSDAKQSGFWVRFGHRYLLCADWNAGREFICNRFHAQIELIDGTERWDRERQKRTFHEAEAFYEFIFPEVQPMLERLQEEMNRIELSDLCAVMEQAIAMAFPGKVKATRRPRTGEHPGGVKPTGTGKKHENFKNHQPGGNNSNANGSQKGITIRFTFEHKGEDANVLAVQLSPKACLVTFNEDTGFVRAFLKHPATMTFTALQAFLTEAAYKNDFLQLSMFETPMERYCYAVSQAFKQVLPAFVEL